MMTALGNVRMARRPQLAGTYSIVALDKGRGQMGVAVQSHYFSVGGTVPWAESGVGVVATQSLVDISYGPLGLALMKSGKTPQQAMRALTSADPGAQSRQVAMLDVSGNVAAHTGENCIPEAGHVVGGGFSVQANLMRSKAVWPAMARAFSKSRGPLAHRLMDVLEAAEEAGGDARGKQSAAMLVVNVKPSGKPWMDKVVDLRVEDSPEPLKELRRLIRIQEASVMAETATGLLAQGKFAEARSLFATASRKAPELEEIKFWQGVALLNSKKAEQAVPLLREATEANKDWTKVLKSLTSTPLLTMPPKRLERILRKARIS